MKKLWIIIGVVIILGVLVVGLLWSMNRNTSTTTSTNTGAVAAATITYYSTGFSPATVTVKSGDTIAIRNLSNSVMQLESNPHPIHTDDTDLNVGQVNAGQTKTFVVTKKGTFGFHNHLSSSNTGKITVE